MTCNGSGFEPSVFVEAFHDIPHVDIDLKLSTDQFAISQAYFEVSNLVATTQMYTNHQSMMGVVCVGVRSFSLWWLACQRHPF